MTFARFYRYDFAVTQIFTDSGLSSKYDGICISAHLLSYTPTSVIQLLNETKKPFFIDPMTFVFARDIGNICRNGIVRRSYRKLMSDYGPPFSSCSANAKLTSSSFEKSFGVLDDTLINDVCKRVLNFQQTKCNISTGFAKYDKLLKKKGFEPHSVFPDFLVAPYFFAGHRGPGWYEISLGLARQARELKGDAKLYPVICISKDILWDNAQISDIVKDYEGFDGYLLWVDDLDEENVSYVLKGLKTLIVKLATYTKPVLSLYGGYLCDLLGKFGLTGYSSGICYGESRSVDARGGGAGNRYYVPSAHLKVSEDLANAFFAESGKNKNLMCRCPTCSEIHNSLSSSSSPQEYSDLFFAHMDFLDFRRHFVNVKFEEKRNLDTSNKTQVAASLGGDIQAISDVDRIPGHPSELTPDHLRVWRTLFE